MHGGHGAGEGIEAGPLLRTSDVPLEKELAMAAANLIQAEEHLLHTLLAVKGDEEEGRIVRELVDDVRATRARVMRMLGLDRLQGEMWCAAKHLLSASYRLLEASEKVIRRPVNGVDPVELAELSLDCLAMALSLRGEER